MKSPAMKNISRIDNPQGRTRGFQVRVRRNGVEYSRFFAGLGTKSLKQAQESREELLKILPARQWPGQRKEAPVSTAPKRKKSKGTPKRPSKKAAKGRKRA